MEVPFVPLYTARDDPRRVPFAVRLLRLWQKPLTHYFVACFVVTWPLQLLLIHNGSSLVLDGGPLILVPLAVAACGPSLAAITVTAACSGRGGMRRLLSTLVRPHSWRIHPGWYLPALVLPTLILLAGDALFSACTHDLPHGWHWIQTPNWQWSVTACVPPLGEELGWRAFALPRLQQRTNALCAALLIGVIWGAWHLPLFLFANMSLPDFPFFFLQVGAASVVMTWLYNSTGGRLGITLVAHLMLNFTFVNYPPISASGVRPIACVAMVAVAVAGLTALLGGSSLRGLYGLRGFVSAATRRRGGASQAYLARADLMQAVVLILRVASRTRDTQRWLIYRSSCRDPRVRGPDSVPPVPPVAASGRQHPPVPS